MQANESFRSSMNKAMTLCSRREYCVSEVLAKLRSWGSGDDDNVRIIELLKKDNFINEERYTLSFVRDKFNFNKWGKIKIAAHLNSKNIPRALIKKALGTIDDRSYIKTISNLLAVHRRSVKANSPYDLKAKLLRYGLSKGFESNILYDLLNDIEE